MKVYLVIYETAVYGIYSSYKKAIESLVDDDEFPLEEVKQHFATPNHDYPVITEATVDDAAFYLGR